MAKRHGSSPRQTSRARSLPSRAAPTQVRRPSTSASERPPTTPVRGFLLLIGLLAATLISYQPAWHGAPVWDDDGHLTQQELRTSEGLKRIWIEPGATQQY